MRASSSFVFVVTAAALATLTACTVNSSDGVGDGVGDGDGDDGTVDTSVCVSTNESDVGQCDVDCDTAVVGEDGIYECTVSCVDDADCSGNRICVELTDGTGACLEDCESDRACTGLGDACDADLLVCLPGGGVGGGVDVDDGICVVETVTDADSCDADCNTIVEGQTAYKCTLGCDPDAQDCGESDLYCLTMEDGTGACVEDCAGGATCSDESDHCDASLEVCLPGEGMPDDGDGTCETANVSDPATCDVDCDTYVEGTVGVYQCTISCDSELQDCGDPAYFCETLIDGSSLCVYDCAGGTACPADYVCDEAEQVCVPDAISR